VTTGTSGIALTPAQRFAWLRLSRCETIGPKTFRQLINRFGSAEAALEALPHFARRGAAPLRIASIAEIEAELEAAVRLGAAFVALGEPDYPALLREIDSPPPIIAMRGARAVLSRPAVAIVGSRNASAAGLVFTERAAREIGRAGYVIVSGFARGIDARAHLASLETGTIAVIAGGLDKIYPPEHAELLERVVMQGAVISEMPFGWEPRGRDFPRRNRLVSGLAQAMIVVEAAHRSGSLITAKFAADQGRDVFAVPGSPLDPRAEGTNALLRDGAKFCLAPQDVIDALDDRSAGLPYPSDLFETAAADMASDPLWDEGNLFDEATDPLRAAPRIEEAVSDDGGDLALAPPRAPSEPAPSELELSALARAKVVGLLGPSPISVDDLVRAAEATARDVQTVLLELELAGRLERHGGGLVSLL